MNETLFFSFLAATIVILSTPGPSCALATSQAMRYGSRAAIFTVAGDALGSCVHIIIATIGLKLLIGAAEAVLPWLQVAGGMYIVYLGYDSIKSAHAHSQSKDNRSNSGAALRAFLSGFVACVSNPKAIIFFAALFPGFIDQTKGVFLQSLVYGMVFIALDVISILSYTYLVVFASKVSLFKSIDFDRVSAVGLVLVGAVLIIKGSVELLV